jgi:multidrug efflux pump subunit AcrB
MSQPDNDPKDEKQTGIISWFVNNAVAANLLMVSILVAGIFSYQNLNKKI